MKDQFNPKQEEGLIKVSPSQIVDIVNESFIVQNERDSIEFEKLKFFKEQNSELRIVLDNFISIVDSINNMETKPNVRSSYKSVKNLLKSNDLTIKKARLIAIQANMK